MADVKRPSDADFGSGLTWDTEIGKMAPGQPRVIEPFTRCFNAISDWIDDNTNDNGEIKSYQQVLFSLPAAKEAVANIANGDSLNDALMQLQYNAANSPVTEDRLNDSIVGLEHKQTNDNWTGLTASSSWTETISKDEEKTSTNTGTYKSKNGETLMVAGRASWNTQSSNYEARTAYQKLQYRVSTNDGVSWGGWTDISNSGVHAATPGYNNTYYVPMFGFINTTKDSSYQFRAYGKNNSDSDETGMRYDSLGLYITAVIPIG